MSDIQIGVVGRIRSGLDSGKLVKIEDDKESTGGYLVLTWDEQNSRHGFDDWVQDLESLSRYFDDSNWGIEWLPHLG